MRDPLSVIGVLIIGVLVVHEVVFAVRHWACPPAHCGCPLTHKFLAGLPLHGHVVTDATYWRAASKDLTQAKTVGPWLKLPRWKRRLYRTGPVIAAAALLVNWALAATVLGVLGACWFVRRAGWARRLLRRAFGWVLARLRGAWDGRMPERLRTERVCQVWEHRPAWLRWRHRNRIQTMGMLLATVTGTSSSSVQRGVRWNPEYADTEPGEEVARWYLPRGFKATGGEKGLAQEVWQSRIGISLVFSWQLDVDEPVLVMSRAREMPSKVFLADVLDKLDKLDDSKTAIGVDDQGGLGCWSWNTENPHGVINAGSRHGKTELNKCLVGQILRKGGGVTYIDPKETSIQGMESTPGLTLLNDPGDIPAMWEGIRAFRQLMDARRKERMADPTAVAGWNRQLLVLEEVNQFSEMSDEVWEELGEEIPGYEGTMLWKPKRAKKVPPVWRHVKAIAWQAAAFKMHLMVDGQDVQATVLKGARNSLGMRLLGGYLPQQWKFLVGTTPVPPAPPVKGRWCLVNGAEQTWLQGIVASLDPDESSSIWREYARAGRRLDGTTAPVSGGVPGGAPDAPGDNSGAVTDDGVPGQRIFTVAHAGAVTVTDPRGVPVSLAEAIGRGDAPGATLKALRQDRYRSDKGELPDGLVFPKPIAEVTSGKTERFWSGEIAEFNAQRRGDPDATGYRRSMRLLRECPPPVMPGGIPVGWTEGDEASAPPRDDLPEDYPALLAQAAELVISMQHGSAAMLQRKLRVGHALAARLMSDLEALMIVGPATRDAARPRDVLVSPDDLDEVLQPLRAVA